MISPNSTRYSFDTTGRLVGIRSVNDHTITIAYAADRRTITDTSGRQFVLHFSNGKASSLDLPDGSSVTYQYGQTSGNLLSATDRLGIDRDYAYQDGRLRKIFYRGTNNDRSVIVQNTYDEEGRVEEQEEALHLITNTGSHRFEWENDRVRYFSPQLQRITVEKDDKNRAVEISEWSPDLAEGTSKMELSYLTNVGPQSFQPLGHVGFDGQRTQFGLTVRIPKRYRMLRTGPPPSLSTTQGSNATFPPLSRRSRCLHRNHP